MRIWFVYLIHLLIKKEKRLEELIKDKIIKENQIKFFEQYIDRLNISEVQDMFESVI